MKKSYTVSLTTPQDFVSHPGSAALSDRIIAGIRGQYVQMYCSAFNSRTQHFFVNDRRDVYTTPRGKPFLWIRGRQLGGRLHTWFRHTPRVSDYQFIPDDDATDDRRWPLTHEKLGPYYTRVERTLGVCGRRDAIPNVPDGDFVQAPPLSPFEEQFCQRVSTRIPGIHVTPARNMVHNPLRIPIPILVAQKTGRLRIETDTIVRSVLIDSNSGKARGVLALDRESMEYREILGKIVILCASAFESVRILLNSSCSSHPLGVGGDGGNLGRYISDHISAGIGGDVTNDLRNYELLTPSNRDAYDFAPTRLYIPCSHDRSERRDLIGGYGIQLGFDSWDQGKIVTWWMTSFGEMLPRYSNRVTISRDKTDAWGIPAAHIECTHSDNDVRMFKHMIEKMTEIAKIAGLNLPKGTWLDSFRHNLLYRRYLTSEGLRCPGFSIHECGGARMGANPRTSVVNEFCQIWDCDNVFVTDGASFPYIPFPNHTLTIMAITVRACDFILREYKNCLS